MRNPNNVINPVAMQEVVYEGERSTDGLRHGKGVQHYEDGSVYDGE